MDNTKVETQNPAAGAPGAGVNPTAAEPAKKPGNWLDRAFNAFKFPGEPNNRPTESTQTPPVTGEMPTSQPIPEVTAPTLPTSTPEASAPAFEQSAPLASSFEQTSVPAAAPEIPTTKSETTVTPDLYQTQFSPKLHEEVDEPVSISIPQPATPATLEPAQTPGTFEPAALETPQASSLEQTSVPAAAPEIPTTTTLDASTSAASTPAAPKDAAPVSALGPMPTFVIDSTQPPQEANSSTAELPPTPLPQGEPTKIKYG